MQSRIKVGIVLFVISNIAFGLMLLVPLWEGGFEFKLALAAGLAIIGEVLFWISAYLLGKEMIKKYRDRINPVNWFKKKDSDQS
jgi:hypothetical protein